MEVDSRGGDEMGMRNHVEEGKRREKGRGKMEKRKEKMREGKGEMWFHMAFRKIKDKKDSGF